MKFGIIVFPGSNCDADCFFVIKNVFHHPVRYVWHKETDIDDLDCIVLPGGFSYGDYLRTGAIARFSPVMKAIVAASKKGKLIIGICNGFQILLEVGLLPGAMLRNKNVHFICRYVYVKIENIKTAFTNMAEDKLVLKIPIAHNEGSYYIDNEGLKRLYDHNQIVFRYTNKEGCIDDKFNPNGSMDNIAGITNEEGNVLGMMPHPERCCESILGSDDGKIIFRSIINYWESR